MCFHTFDEIRTFLSTVHTPATEATPDEAEFTPGGAELMAEVASILRIDRLDGWANPPAPAGPPPCFC